MILLHIILFKNKNRSKPMNAYLEVAYSVGIAFLSVAFIISLYLYSLDEENESTQN
jgi:hypothetical protein